jgi:uncharacterized protein YegP (UPF0339 family)
MAHRAARFEIVRSWAPATNQEWHARFVAGNGRIVWTTENYTRRGKAMDAIWLFTDTPHGHNEDGSLYIHMNDVCHEIRDVDERGTGS